MFRAAILVAIATTAVFAQSAWILLFDGKSLDGWTWSTAQTPPAPSWIVENGMLRTAPDHGSPTYLLSRDSYTDFELEFEWKAEAGSNSGVKYRFQGYWVQGELRPSPEGPGRIEPVALEYQIIDDAGHADALSDLKHTTAAVYEYWPPAKGAPAAIGVWHKARIVARGLHIEHWLDDRKVVDIDLDSERIQESFRSSKRRGSSPVLAKHERRSSPIALQFHDGKVWFRNLRIRRL